MTGSLPEQHVLLIEDGEQQRSISLDAATYSVGRDHKNAIVLPYQAISREHALLLRVPIPDSDQYRYRIVDGNAGGRPSANGIKVNGEVCRSHDLHKGDVIQFGGAVKASYLVLHMNNADLQELLESDFVDFQSIKGATTDPFATLVATDVDLSTHGIPNASDSSQSMKSFRLYRQPISMSSSKAPSPEKSWIALLLDRVMGFLPQLGRKH